MEKKLFILDETKGESKKGRFLRTYAIAHNIPYFTNQRDLNKELKGGKHDTLPNKSD
jgi:hypothetical protein